MTSRPAPEWIIDAEGSRVPFNVEAICQSLYSATEAIGRPDAFLARELTHAVLHFLIEDLDDQPPTTARIAELIVTVTRELGQHEIARAYEKRQERAALRQAATELPFDDGPRAVVEAALREFSLRRVFSGDLAAAHKEGLLVLGGLESPELLAAAVVSPEADCSESALTRRLHDTRRMASTLVLDSPERLLGEGPRNLAELLAGRELLSRDMVVNVNAAEGPPWHKQQVAGPLFPENAPPARAQTDLPFIHSLLQIEAFKLGDCRLHFHLGGPDCAWTPGSALLAAIEAGLVSLDVTFVFDRPRGPLVLGAGTDRQHPAALMQVGLDLPMLLERGDSALLFDRLPHLARMALSAGVHKRAYLRGQTEIPGQRFFLERARLVVVPRGLDAAVEALTGKRLTDSPLSLDIAERILHTLAKTLADAGARLGLETTLGGMFEADANSDVPAQLQVADRLHRAGWDHTFRLRVSRRSRRTATDVSAWLRFAWERTQLTTFALGGLAEDGRV